MTWLDWVVIAMAVYFVAQGLFKGITAAMLGAVVAFLAYVLAAIFLPVVGERVAAASPLEATWDRTAAFVFMYAVLYVVGMVMISLLPGGKRPNTLAQLLGLIGGAVKWLAVAMSVVGMLQASPLSEGIAQDLERSSVARYVAVLQKQYIQDARRISPVPFPPVGPDSKF
ncbi:MAG: CvpA family protein [Armatimonadota bacterium]|nr:CvpA family protein [Armatimonadota bacterium]